MKKGNPLQASPSSPTLQRKESPFTKSTPKTTNGIANYPSILFTKEQPGDLLFVESETLPMNTPSFVGKTLFKQPESILKNASNKKNVTTSMRNVRIQE